MFNKNKKAEPKRRFRYEDLEEIYTYLKICKDYEIEPNLDLCIATLDPGSEEIKRDWNTRKYNNK